MTIIQLAEVIEIATYLLGRSHDGQYGDILIFQMLFRQKSCLDTGGYVKLGVHLLLFGGYLGDVRYIFPDIILHLVDGLSQGTYLVMVLNFLKNVGGMI